MMSPVVKLPGKRIPCARCAKEAAETGAETEEGTHSKRKEGKSQGEGKKKKRSTFGSKIDLYKVRQEYV